MSDPSAPYVFNDEVKPASPFTLAHARAKAERLGIGSNPAWDLELEQARRGKLLALDDPRAQAVLSRVNPGSAAHSKATRAAAAGTIDPSLRQSRASYAEAGVFEVVPGSIYQVRGVDLANLTIVRGETGWIVLDATSYVETARAAIALLEEALDEPVRDRVRAVIISHSHMDHFGGIAGVVDAAQVGPAGEGKVSIFAPKGFSDAAVTENLLAGPAMGRRATYQFGNVLAADAKAGTFASTDQPLGKGAASFILPTEEIQRDGSRVIDGIEVAFQLTLGTEAPANMSNYFPAYRALWVADNSVNTMHNLYTMRGARIRDTDAWWRTTVAALERFGRRADVVLQGHSWPHFNTPEHPHLVEDVLRGTAAVYKYTLDHTLLLANEGRTAREIAREIELPRRLDDQWFTRPYYGTLSMNARAVYNYYLGFYNGNPVELEPLDEVEEARLFVRYAGGVDRVVEQAAADLERGAYREAATAAERAVYAEPGNRRAREVAADAFEQLGYQAESAIFRNAYLAGALELRGEAHADARPSSGADGQQEQQARAQGGIVAALTPSKLLDYLGVVADGDAFAEADRRFRLVVEGGGATGSGAAADADAGAGAADAAAFTVHVFAGTILTYEGETDEELPTARLPIDGLRALASPDADARERALAGARGDEDAVEALRVIADAVVDLRPYAAFSLIEP